MLYNKAVIQVLCVTEIIIEDSVLIYCLFHVFQTATLSDVEWESSDHLTCTPVSTQTDTQTDCQELSPTQYRPVTRHNTAVTTTATECGGIEQQYPTQYSFGQYSCGRDQEDPSYIDESDTSCNYDILPFSENEYEKFTDAGLTDEDEDNDRCNIDDADEEELRKAIARGLPDPAIDSALGRSVSDENSLSKNGKKLLKEAATAADLDQEKQDSGSGDSSNNMRAATVCGDRILTMDAHDVGYSSESHSNEEADGNGFTNPLHASSPKLNTRVELKLQEEDEEMTAVLRQKDTGDAALKTQWRQSMTSAYDTSSNCSDLAHAQDLDVPFDTSVDTVRENDDEAETSTDLTALTATPNHSFYCMTTIESMTDTEPSSAADKLEAAAGKSGATTDAECDLSRSLDSQ